MLGNRINVIIRVPRQNGSEIFFDKAIRKRDKKTGKEFYYLKRSKRNAPAMAFQELTRTNRGVFAELYSPAPGEYHEVTFEKGNVKAMRTEQKNFYVDQIKHSYERWQNKKGVLDKLMPVLMIAMFAFAIILIFWGFSRYGIDAIATNIKAVGNAASKATHAFEDLAIQIQTSGAADHLATPPTT